MIDANFLLLLRFLHLTPMDLEHLTVGQLEQACSQVVEWNREGDQ